MSTSIADCSKISYSCMLPHTNIFCVPSIQFSSTNHKMYNRLQNIRGRLLDLHFTCASTSLINSIRHPYSVLLHRISLKELEIGIASSTNRITLCSVNTIYQTPVHLLVYYCTVYHQKRISEIYLNGIAFTVKLNHST